MRLAILLLAGFVAVTAAAGQLGFRAAHALRIAPAAPVIGTGSALPWATLDAAYAQTLTASGGTTPYTWTLTGGTLPQGLTLGAAGLLSGTPVQNGVFNFTVTVAGANGESADRAFNLVVVLPPSPSVTISGLPDTLTPAQQPEFDIQLSSAYSRDITGTVTLTFTPNAVNASDDPAVQFSTGGRTLGFTVPAGQTSAAWASPPALQAGTVAGQIRLALRYSAAGQDLTPTFVPTRTATIARGVPKIDSVQLVVGSGGVQVSVAGYSTPREVTQATFTFTAALASGSQTVSVTVDVKDAFTSWYTGASSTQYGSAFLYTQPFTVQGNASNIKSVELNLSSTSGISESATASVP